VGIQEDHPAGKKMEYSLPMRTTLMMFDADEIYIPDTATGTAALNPDGFLTNKLNMLRLKCASVIYKSLNLTS